VITKQDITEIAAVLDEQAEARRYLRTRADSLCEDAFGPTDKESLTIPNCPPAVATRVPEESLFADLPPSRPWSDEYLNLLASKPHWVQAEIMAFPTGVMARNLAVELAERGGKS